MVCQTFKLNSNLFFSFYADSNSFIYSTFLLPLPYLELLQTLAALFLYTLGSFINDTFPLTPLKIASDSTIPDVLPCKKLLQELECMCQEGKAYSYIVSVFKKKKNTYFSKNQLRLYENTLHITFCGYLMLITLLSSVPSGSVKYEHWHHIS